MKEKSRKIGRIICFILGLGIISPSFIFASNLKKEFIKAKKILPKSAKVLVLEDLAKEGKLKKILSGKKIGVFLGSFDPLHRGHEDAVRLPIQKGLCDYVLVYPTWGGDTLKKRTDLHNRLDMLFSVFREDSKIILTRMPPQNLQNTLTIQSDKKTEHNDILMVPKFKDLKFIGITGSDTALAYKGSSEAKKIFFTGILIPKKYENHTIGGVMALPAETFIIIKREGDDLSPLNGENAGRPIIDILESKKFKNVSSTLARNFVKQNNFTELERMVSEGAIKVIKEKMLYK